MPDPGKPLLGSIAGFYDNITAMEIIFGEHIHLGYWPDGATGSAMDAQIRLTDLVIAHSGVRPGLHVLDVGCGTGGPARQLARATGASVTGITLSAKQAEAATDRTLGEDIAGRTTFQVADAAALPFADRTFDAAIAIESIMHMPDKHRALREIARVLRPGAVLVTADMTRRAPDAGDDFPLLDLLDIFPPGAYASLAREAGFELVELRDISGEVKHSYAEMIERLTGLYAELAAAWGPDDMMVMAEAGQRFITAGLSGELRYELMTVRKTPQVSRDAPEAYVKAF